MQVIRVIPLAALPNAVPQVLDYFWANPLPQGSLVRVIVGRRSVNALVLESLDLEQAKLAVKKATFGMKKISTVISDKPQATSSQIALARWMARQYYASLGLCAKTILPSWLGKRGYILKLRITNYELQVHEAKTINFILTQPDTALKEMDRTMKRAKGQVLLVLPEVALAEHFARELSEHSPTLVHGELSAKEHAAAYRSVSDGQARVIIGTRLALFLPFQNLTHVIIEDPLHEAFKSDMAPRYAAADVARELSAIHDARLTYLSPAVSTVNHYLIKKDILRLSDRKSHWPRILEIDMAQERQHNPSILSRRVQEAILDAYDGHRPMLIFSPRRAYASHISCEHCHESMQCKTCGIPMRLNRYAAGTVGRPTENMLVCYHCAAFSEVPKQCPHCHAGRFKPAGLAGSQQIAEAINRCLDNHGCAKLDIPILDTDLVKDKEDEREILDKLKGMEHPLLVATQKIFGQRYMMGFSEIAVIEADALVYNPDFRTQERLIYQLEKLADFKPDNMYLQSWDSHGALAHAAGRTWPEFHEQELKERKALGWPPFVRLVKMTFSHHLEQKALRTARICADRLRRTAEHMKLGTQVNILGPTPALVERAGGRWRQNIIIKTALPSDRLNALLAHSEPGALIDIDPRSIT